MNFLAGFFVDGQSRNPSSKRLIFIVAGLCLSAASVILACAAAMGFEVEGSLWAVTTPLAAMATGGYVGGKAAERSQRNVDPA